MLYETSSKSGCVRATRCAIDRTPMKRPRKYPKRSQSPLLSEAVQQVVQRCPSKSSGRSQLFTDLAKVVQYQLTTIV